MAIGIGTTNPDAHSKSPVLETANRGQKGIQYLTFYTITALGPTTVCRLVCRRIMEMV